MKIKRIKQLREKLGLTQAEAASRANMKSKQAWSNVENGYQQNPTLDTLERVAKVLGVKAKDLLI